MKHMAKAKNVTESYRMFIIIMCINIMLTLHTAVKVLSSFDISSIYTKTVFTVWLVSFSS